MFFRKLACSFCGKRDDEVKKLVAGPRGVYICDECVAIAQKLMIDDDPRPALNVDSLDVRRQPGAPN